MQCLVPLERFLAVLCVRLGGRPVRRGVAALEPEHFAGRAHPCEGDGPDVGPAGESPYVVGVVCQLVHRLNRQLLLDAANLLLLVDAPSLLLHDRRPVTELVLHHGIVHEHFECAQYGFCVVVGVLTLHVLPEGVVLDGRYLVHGPLSPVRADHRRQSGPVRRDRVGAEAEIREPPVTVGRHADRIGSLAIPPVPYIGFTVEAECVGLSLVTERHTIGVLRRQVVPLLLRWLALGVECVLSAPPLHANAVSAHFNVGHPPSPQ